MSNSCPAEVSIDAVIFDLDGTLADTFPLIVAAWNVAMLAPTGRTFSADEVISRFGIPDEAMVQRELAQAPAVEVEAAWKSYIAHYENAHATVRPFPGIAHMLQALQDHGTPLGVMTGKGRATASISIGKLGWKKFFDSIVTGDDVLNQKPAPDGLLLAANELDVAPQRCAFVGDSPADINAGKAAGMFTIVAGWHQHYHEQLRALGPDRWATTPQDVLRFCFGEACPQQ
jgi:2-phosphoglycolate phosphatase